MNSSASQARETARETDGKFGHQAHDRAAGIDLQGPGSALAEQLGWDPDTAEPSEFDGHLQKVHEKVGLQHRTVGHHMSEMHRIAGDRKQWMGRHQVWSLSDEAALEKARDRATDPHQVHAIQQYDREAETLSEFSAQRRELDDVFSLRGGWNRAFLVANAEGHVHSSMSCSTCRPSTQFAWMTDHSGKDEGEIVADAGYRACTVCYPSAPLGDERSLPTKMFSDEEKIAAEAQVKRRAETAAKKSKAAANAPTATGEPLEMKEPGRNYPLVFKTERTAVTWTTDSTIDQAHWVAYRENNPDFGEYSRFPTAGEHQHARELIIRSLAEKRGVDPDEVRSEMRKKVHAKLKRDWSESPVRDRMVQQIDDLLGAPSED